VEKKPTSHPACQQGVEKAGHLPPGLVPAAFRMTPARAVRHFVRHSFRTCGRCRWRGHKDALVFET